MDDERARRARSFGQVAAEYDRRRPGYPDALYDDVLRLSRGARILEAGAGTGRATLALARRGASVVAIEPDAQMAAVARRQTHGLDVQVLQTRFEDCEVPAGTFDLVVSAQAWHWVDAERGAQVAARALVPDGALCLWWNRPRDLVGAVWVAVQRVYAEHAPDLVSGALLRPQPAREGGLPRAAGFGAWTRTLYDWALTYDADGYLGLVQTHSDHIVLPADQRERLILALRKVIDEVGGGRIEYPYRTVLRTARPA